MNKPVLSLTILGVGLGCLLSFTPNLRTTVSDELSPVRTPADELQTFRLEPGLNAQLVASEPMVQDPVVISFDADGRLWVVGMRGFMATIDGKGENQPTGRVSVLEDLNGDGQMDKSTVFADSLVMPRALALVPGGALIGDYQSLWYVQDLDGDLKADRKTLVDPKYSAGGLPEHAPNGMWRNIDNWYYNAKSRIRYRLTANGEWQRDTTEFRGQWGISHDNSGHLYYNYNWSQLHADLVPPNYLNRNKHHTPTTGIDYGVTPERRVYPVRATPAVNRGYIPGTLDKEGRLQEFTAACSPFIYRGTALPQTFQGNAFVCEPAGNLIKRNRIEVSGLLPAGHDPHPGQEFLASTDERFRPVYLATGPDGALYIADMYRGLIQHGAYITPYLKEQTLARKLDAPVHGGRIWRIVPADWHARLPQTLSKAATGELVRELASADGWHRDMAQRLLVERADKSSLTPLVQLARKGPNELGRLHALWTLDGLGMSQAAVLIPLLTDKSTLIQTTALRLLEPLATANAAVRAQVAVQLTNRIKTAPVEVALQVALSARALDMNVAHALLAQVAARYNDQALIRDAVMSSLQDQELVFLRKLRESPHWQTRETGKEILLEMLTSAIIRKADATEMTAMLSLLDVHKPAASWQQLAIWNGMSAYANDKQRKPTKLVAAPALLVQKQKALTPEQQAALNSLFEWPGHSVQESRSAKRFVLSGEEQKLFVLGRQHYLTTCAGCHGSDGNGLKRFAPPLNGSDWVTGDEKRLALIVLHGLEGPIEVAGKTYDSPEILPVMPSLATMDDAAISAVLMYIRNAWSNDGGPINRRTVSMTRVLSQGRVMPWTAKELNQQ
ncbi:DUF7133 domain-containing protein [Arsenicibacter rosenii]|uniref:Dehydrogenase n=1 Tax=Arsenicibacter rosenii TaxID=1750698 RepID=A0A1S2VI56_9BACT|nr:c-type cytochrome [Arsenicibacter rosenii]OIN58419.1 dehydrogenase [Arsenicibacter rosenii]